MDKNVNTNLLGKFGESCENKGLWKPEVGESYFFAEYSYEEKEYLPTEEILGIEDNGIFDFPIFKSVEECRKYCHRLNRELK